MANKNEQPKTFTTGVKRKSYGEIVAFILTVRHGLLGMNGTKSTEKKLMKIFTSLKTEIQKNILNMLILKR